ncbi:hypothetical protein ACFQ4K_25950 [Tistrella bauzanensis]
MTALVKALARGLEIRPAVRVACIGRDAGIWTLTDDQDAVIGRGRRLIVTTPPEQALDLLIDTVLPEGWRRRIAGTLVAPCWALMLATAQPCRCRRHAGGPTMRRSPGSATSAPCPAMTATSRPMSCTPARIGAGCIWNGMPAGSQVC